MNGWDFKILWEAGRAVLEGVDPYTVDNFFYPLPVAYFFALFALMPYPVAFWLWLAISAALMIVFFRRLVWAWVLYAPVLHLFSSGQVEMIFWTLERLIYPSHDTTRSPGWRGAAIAALITLKPQAALVLLAWYGFHWLRTDRAMIVRTGVVAAAIWGAPMLWRPRWIFDWFDALPPGGFVNSAGNAPGIWSVAKLMPSLWPLLMSFTVIILIWTYRQQPSNPVTRACAEFALPVGMFYSAFTLLGTAPARVLVPMSLFVAALTIAVHNFVPFALLPLTVIIWHRYFKPDTFPDDPPLPPGHIYAHLN